MTYFQRVLSGVAAGALLVASPAFADWEADLQFKPPASERGGLKEMKGTAHGRKGAMRMDMQTPQGPMSMLVDYQKRTATNLLHNQKMAMQVDLTRSGADVPQCGDKDVDGCLAAGGYKSTGTEKVNGHPCTVYEKTRTGHRGPEHVKLWRPTDLAEVPFVRSQSTDASGKPLGQVDLTNVKIASQPASLFTVPAGYQQMQAPVPGQGPRGAGAFKASDFQGKTPEQIRELIMKQQGQLGAHAPGKSTGSDSEE